jgi:hypothetical protein
LVGNTIKTTIQAEGYQRVDILSSRQIGSEALAYLPLVSEGVVAGDLSGQCLPWAAYTEHVGGERSSLIGVVATLRPGFLLFPATGPCVGDCRGSVYDSYQHGCCRLTVVNSEGGYTFTNLPAGVYTVECGLRGVRGHEAFVLAGEPYAPPTGFMPPYLVGNELYITVTWDAAVPSLRSIDFDVDVHIDFAGCHVFYGQKNCGGTSLLIQGPQTHDSSSDTGSAPGVPSNVPVEGTNVEAVMVDGLRDISYVLYAELDLHGFAGTPKGIINLRVEAYTATGKVAQALGAFDLQQREERYLSMFCMSGAGPLDTVRPDIHRTRTPPGFASCKL